MATAALVTVNEEFKRQFAAAFVRMNGNAAAAALSLIVDNPGEAMRQSNELPRDPFVVAEIDRIRRDGSDEDKQPSRVEIANMILDRAKECKDSEDFERLMRLYCNTRGFTERTAVAVVNNNTVQNVMIVRDLGTDEDWKIKSAHQQQELTANA